MLTPNIDRLQRLRALLEPIQDRQIDLSTWGCGTCFCAVGWATQDPQFQAEGLSMHREDSAFPKTPAYQGTHHWEAVQLFFGLSYPQSQYLFAGFRPETHTFEFEGETVYLRADRGCCDKDAVLERLDTFIFNAQQEAACPQA